jgi:hypothetical protein
MGYLSAIIDHPDLVVDELSIIKNAMPISLVPGSIASIFEQFLGMILLV